MEYSDKITEEKILSILNKYDFDKKYFIRHLERIRLTVILVLKIIRERGIKKILDLGTYGEFYLILKEFYPDVEIICCNYWQEKIAKKFVYFNKKKTGSKPVSVEFFNFNIETDRFPFEKNSFDMVFCFEVLEHLGRDPMHMLIEANRILRKEGLLALTTPNSASLRCIDAVLNGFTGSVYNKFNINLTSDRHNREYSTYELELLLKYSGFSVKTLFTKDVWDKPNKNILRILRLLNKPINHRGEDTFIVAKKVTKRIERFPLEFYEQDCPPSYKRVQLKVNQFLNLYLKPKFFKIRHYNGYL